MPCRSSPRSWRSAAPPPSRIPTQPRLACRGAGPPVAPLPPQGQEERSGARSGDGRNGRQGAAGGGGSATRDGGRVVVVWCLIPCDGSGRSVGETLRRDEGGGLDRPADATLIAACRRGCMRTCDSRRREE